MKILWINPVGTDRFDRPIGEMLKKSARQGTEVDIISLPYGRPTHLEYHAYEGLVTGDIVTISQALSDRDDALVIDAVIAPFKLAELLAETAGLFRLYPGGKWGSEPPPQEEVESMGLFKDGLHGCSILRDRDIKI